MDRKTVALICFIWGLIMFLSGWSLGNYVGQIDAYGTYQKYVEKGYKRVYDPEINQWAWVKVKE